MGLLEVLLGKENPVAQWAGQNQNALSALGAGIASGPTFGRGIATGLDALPKARLIDMQLADKREEEAEEEQVRNYTKEWLEKNRPELLPGLEMGMTPADLFAEAMKPVDQVDPTSTISGRQGLASQYGLSGDALTRYVLTGEMPSSTQPNAPSGYQFGVDGSLAPIVGGPADPNNPLNARRTHGGTPSPTIAKEIFESDEGAQAGQNVIKALDTALQLNDSAWDGPLADIGSAGAALLGNQDAVQTQELKNIVTANALESLKATFGAAPTEGERRILLEVQGSVNQPRAVRKAIFERAKAAAQRRLQFNEERARALRGGDYFEEGYSPVGGPVDPVSAADALLNSGKY